MKTMSKQRKLGFYRMATFCHLLQSINKCDSNGTPDGTISVLWANGYGSSVITCKGGTWYFAKPKNIWGQS